MNINPDQQFTFAHYTCMSTHAHTRTHAHARTHTHSHLHTLTGGYGGVASHAADPTVPQGKGGGSRHHLPDWVILDPRVTSYPGGQGFEIT